MTASRTCRTIGSSPELLRSSEELLTRQVTIDAAGYFGSDRAVDGLTAGKQNDDDQFVVSDFVEAAKPALFAI